MFYDILINGCYRTRLGVHDILGGGKKMKTRRFSKLQARGKISKFGRPVVHQLE
jgi:hypothetical protein